MYGAQVPSLFPSILITVSASNDPNTIDYMRYPVLLKGVKYSQKTIYIIRYFNSDSEHWTNLSRHCIISGTFDLGTAISCSNGSVHYSSDKGNTNTDIECNA